MRIRFGTLFFDVRDHRFGLGFAWGVLTLRRLRTRLGAVGFAMVVTHALDRLFAILAAWDLLSDAEMPEPIATRNDARHELHIRRRTRSVGGLTRFAFAPFAQTNRILEPARKKCLQLGTALVGPILLAAGAAARHGAIVMRTTELAAHFTHLLGQRGVEVEVGIPRGGPCSKLHIPVDQHRAGAAMNLAGGRSLGEPSELGLARLALSARRPLGSAATLLATTIATATFISTSLVPRAMLDLRVATPTPRALAPVDGAPNVGGRRARTPRTLAPRG